MTFFVPPDAGYYRAMEILFFFASPEKRHRIIYVGSGAGDAVHFSRKDYPAIAGVNSNDEYCETAISLRKHQVK